MFDDRNLVCLLRRKSIFQQFRMKDMEPTDTRDDALDRLP